MDITLRSRPAIHAFLVLTLAACGGSRGSLGSDTNPPIAGSKELRETLEADNIRPLPPPPVVDDKLFALGQSLYFDKILSGNHDVSCATCHWPELATADDRTLPQGVGGTGIGRSRTGGAIVPRNSPAALNLQFLEFMFWDGRVGHSAGELITPAGEVLTAKMRAILDPRWELVAAQALFPATSRDEMRGHLGESELGDIDDEDTAAIWDALVARLMDIPEYQRMFLAAYPTLTSIHEVEFAHAANAIAAFEVKAFARCDSPFEQFVQGDNRALTKEQIVGAREFFGTAGCSQCHSGNLLTDHGFHNTGRPQFGPGKGDGATKREDFGRERITRSKAHRFQFRTASLLNVELTAPYGHIGQYATLADIVHHYANPGKALLEYDIFAHVTDPELTGTLMSNHRDILANLDPLLQVAKKFDEAAVVAFLKTLTAASAADMPALIPAGVPSGLPIR